MNIIDLFIANSPYDSVRVADTLLKIAEQERIAITPLTLEKLLYIAHGWHWAIYDKPLVKEYIQVGDYAPVIDNVKTALPVFIEPDAPIYRRYFRYFSTKGLKSKSEALIRKVLKEYGRFRNSQLRYIITLENSPYKLAKNRGCSIIEEFDIINYYKALGKENKNEKNQ